MKTPKKVIFDMDGLIFDSERVFMRELGEVMKPHGYIMRRENYLKTLGLTADALKGKVLEIYGEDYPHEEFSEITRVRVGEIARAGKLPVKEGIRELLAWLKERNIPCAVASSSKRRYVLDYLNAAGLEDYFETVIGGDDVSCSKPEPDVFLAALGDIPPEEALVLEDSENGIIAASRAGIPVICIPDMLYPRDEIKALTAAVVASAKGVLDMISNNRVLDTVEPRRVMKYFEDLCSIPHGSRDTGRVAEYCMEFAKAHGLEATRDSSNNVIIKKPRSEDCKSERTVIIQGHLDMVCAKEPEYKIDFSLDGLHLLTKGNYIEAEGTSLGGDDSIAIAMALAVLEADNITHPALECVFTTDEEIGMLGVTALDMSGLKGEYLLNIDSEEEGVFTVSCAGGAIVTAAFPTEPDDTKYSHTIKITVGGLAGGHSGMEINKGRANACILLANVLTAIGKHTQYSILDIAGGEKDNAIPRSAEAIIFAEDYGIISMAVTYMQLMYKDIYNETDPKLFIKTEKITRSGAAFRCDAARMLSSAPNGTLAMSEDIEGLVKTSSNAGIIRTENGKVSVIFSVRSSSAIDKHEVIDTLTRKAKKYGASVSVTGEYPAWEYKKSSALRDTCVKVYRELYGAEPKISAIHAGLECGIFCGKKPELDCISFGPNILDIHTTGERLDIASTERVYRFLVKLLGEL
ncbi:MAG: beta-Ala-His dipeptidase [Clostridia bacterium]|nr:beta-Ala-His dipeptidase [Clostridia bacterium]